MKKSALTLILAMAMALVAFAEDAPELITPTLGQHHIPTQGTFFAWVPKAGYHTWILQVADNQGLGHPFIEVETHATSLHCPTPLPAGAHLYWRVLYVNDEGQVYWSGTGHFWTTPFTPRRVTATSLIMD
jgi:hypothetical protein